MEGGYPSAGLHEGRLSPARASAKEAWEPAVLLVLLALLRLAAPNRVLL